MLASALDRMSADAGEALQELIESSRSPEVVRLVWRELEELRVLDAACGDGEWLSGCLEGLVGVGESCLARMRGWVEDQHRSGERCRPEKLADFKRLLWVAAELEREGGRERLPRELILLRCLRGVERDAVLAAACRRRLAAGLAGGAGSEVDAELARALPEVREGAVAGGIESAEELAVLARQDSTLAGSAGELAAEAAALVRVERQLTRMRLREAAGWTDLIAGLRTLRARRRVVGQALSARLPGRAEDTVHPWIEFHEAACNGGFDLVRHDPEGAVGPDNSGR
jgi:hypothetical protein